MSLPEPDDLPELEEARRPHPETPAPRTSSLAARLHRLTHSSQVWALADQATVSGTNFLTNVAIARLAGVEAFGAFALAWMVVLFVNLFQNAMILSPMSSFRPRLAQAEVREYLGAILIHETIFAAVSAILVQLTCAVAAAYFHKPELHMVGPGLSAATFCYLTQDFLRRYLFTTGRSRAAFWTDVLSYPPQVLLIALVAKIHGVTTGGALWIVAATSAAGIVAAFFFLEPFTLRWSATRDLAARNWAFSKWLTFSVILDWLSLNLFFIIAPLFFGAVAAGVIRAAQNLVGVAHIWFLGMSNITPAETARALHEGGIEAAERYMRRVNFSWGGLTIAFCTVVALFPGLLLRVVYGASFQQYGNLLRLYALLYVILYFGFPLRAMLQALEYTAPIFWANVVMALLAVVSAVPLVRSFGIYGVVLGSILRETTLIAILYAAVRNRIRRFATAPQPADLLTP